jgi:hypothetical protein
MTDSPRHALCLPRFARCIRAASAVEFAMLLPLFLVLVFGIVVFGAYLTMVHGVQQLAAEAARSSVAGLSEVEWVSHVTTNAGSYPLLQPGHLTVSAARALARFCAGMLRVWTTASVLARIGCAFWALATSDAMAGASAVLAISSVLNHPERAFRLAFLYLIPNVLVLKWWAEDRPGQRNPYAEDDRIWKSS